MLPSQVFMSTSRTAAALFLMPLLNRVQGQVLTVLNNTRGLTGFPPCDALISANLSHAVHLPSSPLYPSLVLEQWSLDAREHPWCFVLPSTVSEVSQTLVALESAGDGAGDWHIAIRSGGHASGNSNNIADGVTIDLSNLNATTYDAATNIASVGTGARWQSVLDTLDEDGVSVTGGREGSPGVGGFVLGGGNSWYTARHGFSCDSVVNYEVVLASGTVINANASVHSDLWQALKGGSGNFGIVTRFDIEAFPASNLTIERRALSIEHSDAMVDAMAGFTDLDQSFQDNAVLSMVAYDPKAEDVGMLVIEVNTANDANTTAFDAFNRIPTSEPSTKQSLSYADSANSSQVAGSTRNAGSTLTFANDPRVMRYCIELHAGLVADLNTTIGPHGFATIMDFQPLPSYFAGISEQKGGNLLGLEQSPRNKILFVVGATLSGPNSEDQIPQVYEKVAAMVQRIEAFAKSIGSNEHFVYLNYADTTQDALGSYGATNVEHIQQVAKKYDPEGFFQSRVPGGFKIARVD